MFLLENCWVVPDKQGFETVPAGLEEFCPEVHVARISWEETGSLSALVRSKHTPTRANVVRGEAAQTLSERRCPIPSG